MPMPEGSEPRRFANIAELLRSVAGQAHELRQNADQCLKEKKVGQYVELLVHRAILIRSLPDVIKGFKVEGGVVPGSVEDAAAGLSEQATQHLEESNVRGMYDLLSCLGSLPGEPDELLKLAMRHSPDGPPA